MLRAHRIDRESAVKYSHEQPPMSQADAFRSSLQNNTNSAYSVELVLGAVGSNNKSYVYVTRACRDDVKYHISLESLIAAYYDCRRNKRTKNECVRFEFERERSLIDLQQQIERGNYKPLPSKAFVITYPTYREVFAAAFRDRIIHHWIALRIEPIMEKYFINDSYNCRKGRGTDYGVRRAVEMFEAATNNWVQTAYVMKWDFASYFMSIRKDVLWRMVRKIVQRDYNGEDKQTLLYLLHCTIFNAPQNNCVRTSRIEMWDKLPKEKSLFSLDINTGIPIGNLTSQLFANYYLCEFDRWLSERHKHYGRYVDDGWIIDNDKDKILRTAKMIKAEAARYGVRMHPSKFYFQRADKGVRLIGVKIKPHRVYVSNRSVGKAMQRAYYFNKVGTERETPYRLQACVNSYLGYMKHYTAYGYRKMLCENISPEWYKYVAVVNNYKKIKISEYDKVS